MPSPSRGHSVAPTRSKTTAVLLAVFLSFWTWLYTYRRDAARFWIGLGGACIGGILMLVYVGFFITLGIWIWAIVDASSKPDAWYHHYPYWGEPLPGNAGRTAVVGVDTRPELQSSYDRLPIFFAKPEVIPSHMPAGWYSDPRGVARERYWNGKKWTNHTA